jgi:glycosyltransferase involved in cell wall biosynthesis
MRLSAVVIACNEAAKLQDCLESVRFADEIVVLDSGSTDDTVEIARAAGAKVTQVADWPGFGPQKNRALALASGDWILSIDADERVSEALRSEIQTAISRPQYTAYAMNRSSSYCGRFMEHSGWYPDPLVRLFRRGTARFSDDLVHERLIAEGPIGHLNGDLIHLSFDNFEAVLAKVDRYSTAGALAMHRKGVRGSLFKAIAHGAAAFLRTYVLRRGFLDGQLGFALAVSNAEGTYYRYLKLWLLQRAAAPWR